MLAFFRPFEPLVRVPRKINISNPLYMTSTQSTVHFATTKSNWTGRRSDASVFMPEKTPSVFEGTRDKAIYEAA